MTLIFWIVIFVISLAVLVKAADYFTKYSERLGKGLGIPQFIIGVTIVSIGTSLPELATAIIAVFKQNTEIVAGNAIGSNIANILLVVGLSALIARKMNVKRSLINLDAPLLASVTGLAVFIMWDRVVTFQEGILLVISYIIYSLYSIYSHSDEDKKNKTKKKFKLKVLAFVIISSGFIYLGAKYTIDSVIEISDILNINSSIIALSAIAIGTSLPEVLVSVAAARKGKYEMALGNVFGSNIFNIAMVIGIPAFITDLSISSDTMMLAIPFVILATLLYVISSISQKIYNWEGAMYLLIYILFIGKLFGIL